MAELRFCATGTATLEEETLRFLHLRRGAEVTILEAAAYVFNTPCPTAVQMREATNVLLRLAESGRAKAV